LISKRETELKKTPHHFNKQFENAHLEDCLSILMIFSFIMVLISIKRKDYTINNEFWNDMYFKKFILRVVMFLIVMVVWGVLV